MYLEEKSLKQLVNYANRISPHTKHFSVERQGIEGKPPVGSNMPRLLALDIKNNAAIFHFLSGSTEKYPPDYMRKNTNPETLALERNPSKTYDMYFSFERLDQLSALSKARATKKKYEPKKKGAYQGGLSNITIEEIKAWMKETNVKLFDTSPAFHWQGHNYNIGKLNSSLYPTDIPPTPKAVNPRGWEDTHNGSILSKHLEDIFEALPWYLNQMASMLLKKIRKPSAPAKPPAPPVEPVKPVKPSMTTRPPVQSAPPAPKPNIKPVQQPVNPFGQPMEPQVDIKQRAQVANNQIPQEPEYPGNPDQDPEEYISDEEVKEQTMWKKTNFGYELHQVQEGKNYTTKFITEIKHAENNLLLMDDKAEDFVYSLEEKVPFDSRYSMYEKLHGLEEVTILFEWGNEEQRYRALIEETMDFLKECPYDVITFESSFETPDHAKMTKVISETIQLVLPYYSKTILYHEKTPAFSIVLTKNLRLQEAPDGKDDPLPPPPKDNKVPDNAVHKEAPKESPEEEKKNPLPTKKIVCAFGSFNPVTQDHLDLLDKVKATAKLHKCKSLVFLQANPSFANDEMSLKARKKILQKLSKIPVYTDTEIIDFYKALVWLYTNHFTDVMVIAGNDEVEDMTAMGTEGNSSEGKYQFNNFKVGSFGRNNPDKSQESIQAVNAIMNNDMEGYLKALGLPYMDDLKTLFHIARYEIQNEIGMSESVSLQEAEISQIISGLKNQKKGSKPFGIIYKKDDSGNTVIDAHYYGKAQKNKIDLSDEQVRDELKSSGLDPDVYPELNDLIPILVNHFSPSSSPATDFSAEDKEKRRLALQQAQDERKAKQRDDALRRGETPPGRLSFYRTRSDPTQTGKPKFA